MFKFLGHSVEYWVALESKAETLNVTKLIEEIATLRSKVSFYESRFLEIQQFKKMMDEKEENNHD